MSPKQPKPRSPWDPPPRLTKAQREACRSKNNIDFMQLLQLKKHTYGPADLSEEQRWKDNEYRYSSHIVGHLVDSATINYNANAFRLTPKEDFPRVSITASHNKLLQTACIQALSLPEEEWPLLPTKDT